MAQPFFFFHVMKTGGTTLAFDLARRFPPDAVYPGDPDRRYASDVEPYISVSGLLRAAAARRDALRLYTGHFAYVARELMPVELRTLTLLREPVDRTISVLKHFKSGFERYEPLSLEQIYDDEFIFEHFVHDHQTKWFSATVDDQLETFVSRLTHAENLARHRGLVPAGEISTFTVDAARLERARANLAAVDVVGVTERYDEFVEDLRARFDWSSSGENRTGRANVSPVEWEAPAGLRRRIADDNRFDAELYACALERVERRAGPHEA